MNEMEEQVISLSEIFEAIKKRWIIIVAIQIKYKSKNQQEAVDVLKNITEQFIITSKELVPNGNVRVIEEVEFPENPVSPNKKMNIAIAFLLGLMVSLGLVFLLEYLDNTYKNKEQLEKELDIPVLGVIPDVDIL